MKSKDKKIITQNNCAEGTITEMKKCWWLKINTKPVRSHSLDGAIFPYTVHFKYNVDGAEYQGKKFIGLNTRGLNVGEKITVYYDGSHPSKYAVANICGIELL